jgi:hypothetical protein
LATSGADIGAAWLEDNGTELNEGLLHFTRFGPDLTVLSDTGCLGSATAPQVALASAPTGWLVAEETAGFVHIFALDATETLRGTRDIPLPAGGAGYGDLKLIQQSQGGPLLLWGTPFGHVVTVNAQILAGDASDVGARVTLTDVGENTITGVFTGSGFELAWKHQPADLGPADAIQLAHVALDGTLRMDSSIAGLVPASSPLRLVWTGSEARLIYAGWVTPPSLVTPNPMTAMFLLRLTASGSTVGSPVQISPGGELLDPASLLAVGDDVLGLRVWIDNSGAEHLDLRRVSSRGATVWAPFSVAQAPQYGATQMVQLGADAVVGWFETYYQIAPRLGLTKIALAP